VSKMRPRPGLRIWRAVVLLSRRRA
jgi:hypothetical protein